MSHELRTPLNGILGYAQILKSSTYAPSDQQLNGLNVIEQSGQQLLALINDILDLAKIESGKVELYQINFHLPTMIRSLGEVTQMRAEQKNIYFRLDTPAESLSKQPALPEMVYGDERRLRQVLLNLLENALKFTDTGGITLRITGVDPAPFPQPCHIRFEVEDTGVGIPVKYQQTIFSPFEQVGDQKAKAKGTGLGLSICRNLVNVMGGDLKVKSQPGAGSAFWFEIPLTVIYQESLLPAATSSQRIVGIKSSRSTPGRLPTVLVVDDNWQNRSVFVDLLSPLGFNAIEAENGAVALTKAAKIQPDGILTDLVMPDMSGFELIEQIRQLSGLKDKIIISTSASVQETDQQASLALGSNAFLPKPVEAQRLFGLLERLLGLEWIYLEADTPADTPVALADWVVPPREMLQILQASAKIGDIEAIQDEFAHIAQADERYRPFTARLQQLAWDFKLNELNNLLKTYLSDQDQ
jgi:CheY-like chemotaxis protein